MTDPAGGAESSTAAQVTLTRAVEDLARTVEALREDLGRRTRRLWRWVLGGVGVGAVGLTIVIVYLLATVGRLDEAQRADCQFWNDLGSFSLGEARSEIGRVLVSDARAAAEQLGCP